MEKITQQQINSVLARHDALLNAYARCIVSELFSEGQKAFYREESIRVNAMRDAFWEFHRVK